jgi:hypothetical protein
VSDRAHLPLVLDFSFGLQMNDMSAFQRPDGGCGLPATHSRLSTQATGQVIANVSEADKDDVDLAVAAARPAHNAGVLQRGCCRSGQMRYCSTS